MLDNNPPQLFTLHLNPERKPDRPVKVPALPLWQAFYSGPASWLLMDTPLAGQVVKLRAECSSGIYHLPENVDQNHKFPTLLPFIDWLFVNAQRCCLGLEEDWD